MNSPGLRERKKQRTRWAIQEHALRLFAEQGYESTTIDQIAAAAEVSPSTFFRYFPTKEDLVIQDEYDAVLVEGLRTLPVEVPPLAAIRQTMHAALGEMGPDEMARVVERMRLTLSVPALRARSFENYHNTITLLCQSIGARTGVDPADLRLRVFAGAVVGALIAAFEVWLEDTSRESLAELADRTLAQLDGLTV
jgi:AcrR family transcriptional regulator